MAFNCVLVFEDSPLMKDIANQNFATRNVDATFFFHPSTPFVPHAITVHHLTHFYFLQLVNRYVTVLNLYGKLDLNIIFYICTYITIWILEKFTGSKISVQSRTCLKYVPRLYFKHLYSSWNVISNVRKNTKLYDRTLSTEYIGTFAQAPCETIIVDFMQDLT